MSDFIVLNLKPIGLLFLAKYKERAVRVDLRCHAELPETYTAVHHPAVGLHEHCWAKVLVTVPPVAWTGCATTRAQDALVQAILKTFKRNIEQCYVP